MHLTGMKLNNCRYNLSSVVYHGHDEKARPLHDLGRSELSFIDFVRRQILVVVAVPGGLDEDQNQDGQHHQRNVLPIKQAAKEGKKEIKLLSCPFR